ncbi:MAG: hypothetical protein AMXMBFR82_41330 [Candidatus Hydrogenedentota bacterium]
MDPRFREGDGDGAGSWFVCATKKMGPRVREGGGVVLRLVLEKCAGLRVHPVSCIWSIAIESAVGVLFQ